MKTNMTVEQLINALSEFPQDLEVRFAAPAHDHWRTILALAPRDLDIQTIKHSDYHDADAVEEGCDGTEVVLISTGGAL